ncbi:MAG: sigma-70 family RNA polymerase sigma factor [Planctomycetaceae bacterium]|jgi:RNA polymerase sigma factor for flagellar operon FliA|nr:sigma-70 family RNA polymerase sigma factor [Planctomycetaceae bacterium]
MKNQDEQLWKQYLKDKSNIDARNAIVIRYLPCVEITAKKVFRQLKGNVELDDLIAYGTFGLMDAIRTFDLNRKYKFESFCKQRIYGSIIDAIRKLDWVPRSVRAKQKKNQLENEIPRIISLDAETYNESGESSILSETVRDNKVNKPEGKIIRIAWLQEVLTGLNQTERLIIILYYYDKKIMKEIGEVLNLSESRVSQLHKDIIERLKETKNPEDLNMEFNALIPLELEPEDYERYLEVRKQIENRINSGDLPYTPRNSFVGVEDKPLYFSSKQSKTKKEKNMEFYSVHIAAQKWNIKWQTVLAMVKSGAIPEAVIDGTRLRSNFVEEIAQSTEQFQKLLQKYKEIARTRKSKSKSKPYLETLTKTKNDTIKIVPVATPVPIFPKNHLILSALKNVIQNIETENQNLNGFAVSHVLKEKSDNCEMYDILITLSIEVKTNQL